jgi:hypothetical protein
VIDTQNKEHRECFQQGQHDKHVWHNAYWCSGQGIDPETGRARYYKPLQPGDEDSMLNFANEQCDNQDAHFAHTWKKNDLLRRCAGYPAPIHPENGESYEEFLARINRTVAEEAQKMAGEDITAPAVLDGRQAYGDRVTNMQEQAALWNAYLSGRTIEPHDVPIMYVLTKLHRLGKMPDYGDNYDDAEGYLRIAREVIGNKMIDAPTAKEYQRIKADRAKGENVKYVDELSSEGAVIDAWAPKDVPVPHESWGEFVDWQSKRLPVRQCDKLTDHSYHKYTVTELHPSTPKTEHEFFCRGLKVGAPINTRERGA